MILAELLRLAYFITFLYKKRRNKISFHLVAWFLRCGDFKRDINMEAENCVMCKELLSNGQITSVLREKGSNTINRISALRNDNIHTIPGLLIHQLCRHQYCNKNVLTRDLNKTFETQSTLNCTLRSKEPDFIFAEHCLFCGQGAKISGKKRGYDVFPVRTSDFQFKIQQVCSERNDSWSEKVNSRTEFAQDLHASDAIYHQVFHSNFRTGKQIPTAFQSEVQTKQQHIGRPIDASREEAFIKVTEYLKENDDEQITVRDLLTRWSNMDARMYMGPDI